MYLGNISLGAFWVLGAAQGTRQGPCPSWSWQSGWVPHHCKWLNQQPLVMCRSGMLPIALASHLFQEATSKAKRKYQSQKDVQPSFLYVLCSRPLSQRESVCVEGWEAPGLCYLPHLPKAGFAEGSGVWPTTGYIWWHCLLNSRSEPTVWSRVSWTEGGEYMFLECGLPQVLSHGSLLPRKMGIIILVLQGRNLRLIWSCDLSSGLLEGSSFLLMLLTSSSFSSETHMGSRALKCFETPGDLVSFIPFTYF